MCECRRVCCCPAPIARKPFLSSFLDATGSAQIVQNEMDVVFNVDAEYLDVAGVGIEVNASGTIFTIRKPGLYSIEWSVNVESGVEPIILGVTENGVPTSVLSFAGTSGNYSSGSLINVTEADVPTTISLHNLGGALTLADSPNIEGTAASIRIIRFADGPSRQ